MASKKEQSETAVTPRGARDSRRADSDSFQLSRTACAARFLLVLFASLLLSTLFFSLTASLNRDDLAIISKHLEGWEEVAGLLSWRAVEIGLSWGLGFDIMTDRDVASFLFLTHLPTYSLLYFFYGVRPTSILVSFAITILSTVIPFTYLRKPASVHDLSHAPSGSVANRTILQDRLTTLYTSFAATSIFSVIIYVCYSTWLPAQLVVHFESIPDITAASSGAAGLFGLYLTLIPAGFAIRDFLFVSSAGRSSNAGEPQHPVSREGEYLITAIYRKTWGRLSAKTQVLVSRTFILAAAVLINSTVQIAGTIRGVSAQGASVWGAVWALATVVVGALFGWIEAAEGV
ncbi:hypothetical protein N7468_004569 [Penicillium chermesinum]|uniref:Uncharacterized protein n=1 Tax=Penicillium chermesinum TaxID=63820 RepID=A0A9W9TSP0_9EURO|nr:uncharacterized protein N7468_004569 [Penicillium chermesinum]KAJ5239950.1 hypothetical protein N7468_004569 [Penicillium chermesinum]